MLHRHMDGLVGHPLGRVEQPLDLFNEIVGVARLDDDLIEPGLAGAVELAEM